jgi:hypothetical protein
MRTMRSCILHAWRRQVIARSALLALPPLLALLALLPSPAHATKGPPVQVRIHTDPDVLPVPGQLFYFSVEFESALPLDLVSAGLRSDRDEHGVRHWEVLLFDEPAEVRLQPWEPLRIDCEVLCSDSTQPIFVDFQIGVTTFSRTFYLLPTSFETAMTRVGDGLYVDPPSGSSVVMPGLTAIPVRAPKDDARFERAWATDPKLEEPVESEGVEVTPDLTKSVLRRARGRVMYQRMDDQQWVGCDGCTVRLYDENPGVDTFLGAVLTDPSGRFWIDFPWIWESDPDLYVQFETVNDKVEVERPEFGDDNYSWVTSTAWNIGGTNPDLGVMTPAPGWKMSVLHVHSQLTRAWRQLADLGYGGIASVDVSMPDGDWPMYIDFWEEIYLPLNNDPEIGGSLHWLWNDGTLWHEYGHHIIHEFGDDNWDGNYCNPGGRCDFPGEPCRHCGWCEESPAIAWSEGFPNYVADYMTRIIENEYSDHPYNETGPAVMPRDYEDVDVCTVQENGNDTYDDPSKTESILAALLRDLDDGAPIDEDPIGGGIGRDLVARGAISVFRTALDDDPTTPWEFINAYIARYGLNHDMWATAYNNGYNLDQTPPGVVTNLTSTSHSTSGQSPDATIEFSWTTAPDDLSGIGGYSVWIGPAPSMPDATVDIGDVTELVTGILSPGTYWFSIRAADKVGHWSSGYATYGPITIRDPHPADMAPAAGPSFAYPLVPRNATLTFEGIAPAPSSLARSPLYLNLSVRNWGELATVGSFNQRSWIDGENAGFSSVSGSQPVEPLAYRYHMNQGPFSAPGGRHTLSMRADAGEDLAEWSEYNNFYAQQWIFAPHLVSTATPFVGPAPVRTYAGWEGTAPMFQSVNCTGLRMDTSTATVSAMVLMPLATDDDYDLRSHAMSLGAQSGFSTAGSYAYSMRDSSQIDAVLVVPSQAFATTWDVGVINANPLSRVAQESDFQARQVNSISLPVGAPLQVNWSENEPLALFHHFFNGRDPQPRVIEVVADPAIGRLYVGLYDSEAAHAALNDHIAVVQTNASGVAKLYFTVDEGTWPIVVWRDPKNAPGGALPLPATSFSAEVRVREPDLAAAWLSGWSSPLVPRPAADGTPTLVPLATNLQGDATATWVNAAFGNFSPVLAGAVRSRTYLDGLELGSTNWGDLAGGETVAHNDPTPIHVRGGRHTLLLRLDPLEQIDEESEVNNSWATQTSWRPPVMDAGPSIVRAAPPAPTAGWPELMMSGTPSPSYNVDGLRTPLPTPVGQHGHWQALAVMPGVASDVDLRLHEASNFPALGFSVPTHFSVFGTGQSDYVLTNFRVTSPRSFDVGVLAVTGVEPYTADVITSQFLASQPTGTFGPFTLAAGQFLTLHEVELPAGPLLVRLTNVSGAVDWGMSMHRAHIPLQTKNTPMIEGQAWTEGPGEPEYIGLHVPEAGFYCFAVWKAFAGDLGLSGQYTLEFSDGVTSVTPPAAVPARTTITRIAPNPFNPRTTLHYEVAQASRVQVRLYDPRGREVRTLVDGVLGAGRYEVVWDGTDDAGITVTSGVYFAQLAADGLASWKKLVLLK